MKSINQCIVLTLTVCLTFLPFPYQSQAETGDGPSLQIIHAGIKSAQTDKTVPVTAKITDREGVELVRIYFKASGTKEYYFVPMIVSGGNNYYGLLPAPLPSTKKIEYLFLVKTYNNRIFTSETFLTKIDASKVQPAADEKDTIDVLTEAKQSPKLISGFDPNTKIRLVTKHEKHGVVAGLYDTNTSGGTASTGQYHGQIHTSGSSSNNTLLIAGGVAAGALAIALIAGGGGSSSSPSVPPPAEVVDATGVGVWNLDYTYTPCTKKTTQIVECSPEGLVTDISPAAIGVPLPDTCENTPFAGLSEIFIIGGTCDTASACDNYTASDVLNTNCTDTSITITRLDGSRIERWSVQ